MPDNYLGPLIADYVDQLKRMPERRLRMRLARAAGIRYELALERWPDADSIAIEFAHDFVENEEAWERCSQCHTHPDDVLSPEGRVLEHGRWKLELVGCHMCHELAKANKDLSDADREAGTRWRIAPRAAGEPFLDDGSNRD